MMKLIITDMDGTFLHNDGEFNREYFARVKEKMVEKEKIFAICTGKQCERVEALLGELCTDVWILGDSATRIKYNGKYVYESLLKNSIGKEIMNTLETVIDKQVIIACTPNGAYIHSQTPEKEALIVQKSYNIVHLVDDLNAIEEDFIKITLYDPESRCIDTVSVLDKFKKVAYVVASDDAWIDVSNFDVHKGTTVRELQKLLGISKKETIAFGDGYNDLELFKESGVTFAMKNGYEAVKDSADFIAKTNEEDGVLYSIEKLLY